MILHQLREMPEPILAQALAEFETKFTYPLGPGRTFRISHGDDYPRFFRAMGEATCFIAEQDHRVIGALGVAIRPLVMPEGATRQAAYIGDLKVDPAARGTLAFLRLARAADCWARPQVAATYGVVMDGTRAAPTSYTGRAGVEAFLQLGKLFVLRFPTDSTGITDREMSGSSGGELFRSLSRGRYFATGGSPQERSEMSPLWLVAPDGGACGRLEDTRRAKRLLGDDGTEMRSAHLACFAFRTPASGAELIHAARRSAAAHGFPSLFVAIADCDLKPLESALGSTGFVIAPATVFGAGLQSGHAWNINSSEI